MRLSMPAAQLLVFAFCAISCTHGPRGPSDQTYRGTCLLDFERSDFTPEGDGAFDGDGNQISLKRWWLLGNLGEMTSKIGMGHPAFVVLQGQLSEPGGYGHLGAYERQLHVTKVLEIRQVEAQTYTTRFEGTENPLSEGGKWRHDGLDWAAIRKDGGHAWGTQTGTNKGASSYDDSYAHLSGFPADQEAWGEAYIARPDPSCHQEIEILLRWTSSAHRTTGYECFARCVSDDSSYVQIVRWNGPLGDFTYLADKRGKDYGLKHGDVIKASVVGNVITVSINGVEKARATDDTWTSGDPGIGHFLQCDGGHGIGSNADFGFSSFTARGIEGSSPADRPGPVPGVPPAPIDGTR